MSIIFQGGAILLLLLGIGFFALNTYQREEVPVVQQTTETSRTDEVNEAPKEAPPVITQSTRTLDLSNQGLTKVPGTVFTQTDVEKLNLSHNALTGALQAEVRHMRNLVSLDLSDNNFTGIPAEIGQLSKLEYLDLSNNPVTGLPNELGKLSKLKELDLRGTQYSEQDLASIKKELPQSTVIRTE